MNTPFASNNSNNYTESVFHYAPAQINGQHVWVSQEQQRNLWDQLNTQIIGMNLPPNWVQFNKQPIPGGMLFTGLAPLNTPPVVPQIPQNVWSDLQNNALQSLKYLELNKNRPFELKFHQDVSTSSTDLGQISGAAPDFTNICGVIPSINPHHDRRKLVLKSIPEPIETHVVETVDEKQPKKVTFAEKMDVNTQSDENIKSDKEIQCALCSCETLARFECKTGRRRKSTRWESSQSVSSSEEDSENLKKSKKYVKRKRRRYLNNEE